MFLFLFLTVIFVIQGIHFGKTSINSVKYYGIKIGSIKESSYTTLLSYSIR